MTIYVKSLFVSAIRIYCVLPGFFVQRAGNETNTQTLPSFTHIAYLCMIEHISWMSPNEAQLTKEQQV